MSAEYIFRKIVEWLSIILYPSIVIFWAIRKRKQKIIKMVESRNETIFVRTTALIAYILIILSLSLKFGYINWRDVFPSEEHFLIVVYIGIFITFAADFLMMWSLYNLGENWTMKVAVLENHELVTSGPYHYCRHPMYSAAYVYAIGIFFLSGYWVIGIGLLCMAIGASSRVRHEERQLVLQFGPKYVDYMKQIKNPFVPFLPFFCDCGINIDKEKTNLLNEYNLEFTIKENNNNVNNNVTDNTTNDINNNVANSNSNNGNKEVALNVNLNVTAQEM